MSPLTPLSATLPPLLLLLCFFFTATAAAALLFLRHPAVATGSSSSPLRLLLRRCCCWFTTTIIDINLYYGGPLSNANANKGLSFEGPGIKCYYTQIDHRLNTLNDLKMILMKELCVNPALHNIQIIFRSPHEVFKHHINYKYMAIEADKHVKIMFDKMERIVQVKAIELYIKLEPCVEVVGAEEIQQTTTRLQDTIPNAQYDCGETDADNAISIPSMASLNNEGASFSSSTRQWEYTVFLSFRGEDTREGFTSHLYKALCNKGINTFIDDIDLPRGEEISEKLIQAIKNSSILVIVFSENYAESKWCLDELAEIVECREKDQEVQIRPIFYNVDPSKIRNQNGNFGIALANHEKKFKNNKDKVQRWRDALRKAANASGWHYKKGLSMHDLIQQMGKEVVRQQAPDILGKRSRLCCYEDSLKVLTGNKGSKKIRGIILHSPQPVKVQLHTEAFKKMENLKFLIVENVHICKPLEFLPHNLIYLEWPNYPFHWPFKYFPEQLAVIEMPRSCIRMPKLIKQECHFENLIDVNLSSCKFIMKLPKLWAPNLENLDLSHCENLVELPKLRAQNLKRLQLFSCKNLLRLPKLRAPNLEYLGLPNCPNLVEMDESYGSLEKLRLWYLPQCSKLQILPSQLRLKSLRWFDLSGCSRLEKLPNFHPEMECVKTLYLNGSGIREVPSSIEHLTKLRHLSLCHCKNLQDLPDSIYKLQQLAVLDIPTGKLRPTCNSFDSSSGDGFVKMKILNFRGYEGTIELDLLMKPDYFPALKRIDLSETNVVTIPESISRFPRLKDLYIRDCKLLREIQGLPQSIRSVQAQNCKLLDTQSPSGLLSQVIEIIGILPNRVCGRARSNKLMDPQFTNYFSSKTEGAESEDRDISMDSQFSNNFPSETEGVEYEDRGISMDRTITCWGSEMPKWFNHQSVDNSIFFFVDRKFPKLAICFVSGLQLFRGSLRISINGYENRKYESIDLFGNDIHLFSPTQWSLQRHLNESNPTDQNLVEVSIACRNYYSIERWGVHVECTCPLQEDDAVDYGYSLMHLFGIL